MRATDKVIQKNQNTYQQNRKSDIQLQNGGQKTISISRHKISDQKWENHFPEGIFPWNLAHNWRLWIQLKIVLEEVLKCHFDENELLMILKSF